ncbi:MAG: ATP-binding protein, partial [Bacteroidota bacterium]
SFNKIDQIVEDADGALWLIHHSPKIGNFGIEAIDVLLPNQNQSQSLEDYGKDQLPFANETILKILSGPDQLLIIETESGHVWEYRGKDKIAERQLPAQFVLRDYTSDQQYWGMLEGKLVAYDPLQQQLRTYGVPPDRVEQVVFIGEDQYWVRTELWAHNIFGLKKSDPLLTQTAAFEPLTGGMGGDQIVYAAQQQMIWLRSHRSLRVFDRNQQLVYSAFANGPNPIAFPLGTLYLDEQGMAWTSSPEGLMMAQVQPNSFERYLYNDPRQKNNTGSNFRCRGIWESNGQLFINTYTGRYRVDLASQSVATIDLLPDERAAPLARFPFYQDRSGGLWTSADGLMQIEPTTGEELRFIPDRPVTRSWSIYQDHRGRYWLGKNQGLSIWHPDGSTQLVGFERYNEFTELSESLVLHFYEINEREVLLATNTGLYLLDIDRGITQRYWMNGAGKAYLPTNDFQYIYRDADGVFWLATAREGLIRWDRAEGTYQSFNRKDGFTSNNIYAIYEDDSEHLWMSSNLGIICWDKKQSVVTNFDLHDGLSDDEFNRIAHFQAADGRIYFGSQNGVVAFDPNELHQRYLTQDQFPLQITDYRILIGTVGALVDRTAALQSSSTLVLRPGERIYRLEVDLLDYFNAEQITYYYKLGCAQSEWQEAIGNHLSLTQLPYGEYPLKVKARQANGRFVKEQMELQIIHHQPLSETLGFRLSLLAVLLLLGGYWYKARTRRLRQRQEQLETVVAERTAQIVEDKKVIESQAQKLRQLDQLKSRFFANVSHELRTPITLILGPIRQLLDSKQLNEHEQGQAKMIEQNARQLLKNVNEILDFSSLEAGKLTLRKKSVPLYPTLRRLLSVYETFAETKQMMLRLNYELDTQLTLQLDEDKFEKIVNNLLSNALKYTPEKGKVLVRMRRLDDQLQLMVSDTGPGIPPEDLPFIFDRYYQSQKTDWTQQTGTGIGLALCRELAQLFEGRLWVESEVGFGSRFYFKFPIPESSVEPSTKPVDWVAPMILTPANHFSENQAKGSTAAKPPNPKAAQILLVEDHPDMQVYLQDLLLDYRTVLFSNGQEALDWLQSGHFPDLILTDAMMPVLDGFSLVEQLKENSKWNVIPVVMLTALVGQRHKLTALRIGVDDYMIKPFEPLELQVKIQNLLGNAKERQRIAQNTPPVEKQVKQPGPVQQKWLQQVESICLEKVKDSRFNLDFLAAELHLSPRQLQRKIKQYTGLTANQYLREVRLHQARQLLESGSYHTVGEVSYAIGFEDQHYFSTLFFKRYGLKPSALLRGVNQEN